MIIAATRRSYQQPSRASVCISFGMHMATHISNTQNVSAVLEATWSQSTGGFSVAVKTTAIEVSTVECIMLNARYFDACTQTRLFEKLGYAWLVKISFKPIVLNMLVV